MGVEGRGLQDSGAALDLFIFFLSSFHIQKRTAATTSHILIPLSPPPLPPLPPSSKRERRRAQALRQREIDAGLHGWRAAWADWTARHVPPRWQVLLYNQTEARVAMQAHFPLAGPVLRRLEEVGDWE